MTATTRATTTDRPTTKTDDHSDDYNSHNY
jgi:hypothetical protein